MAHPRRPAPRGTAAAPWLVVPALLAAPVDAAPAAVRAQDPFAQRAAAHWSWQPLADPQPPPVRDRGWARDPLDAFVLARLEQEGLAPAPPAAPEIWLRRVWFDVAGLPPPPDAVRAFRADPSPAARARAVDALLASPHYGERWGRHWLDLVRYAESLGHEYDFPIPNAWRYRDYVVRALNADVPFDRFAREHVAGDLLPEPRIDPATGRNESVHGTAFWWLGEQTHAPVDAAQHQADRIDNQIDVLTKAFLGMTVACARCHDHKFDAIRSADYYALYGFLKSSRYVQQPVHPTPAAAAAEALHAHRELAARAAPSPAPAAATGLVEASLRDPRPRLRAGDVVLADFARADDWFRTGDAFPAEPWRGPFVAGIAGATVRFREFAGAWAHSAARGLERDGVLHSPTFTIDAPFLHAEVAGEDARAVVVVEGLHLVRNPIYGRLHREIARPQPHWITFDVSMWIGQRAHLQFLDQRAHDLADAERNLESYPDHAWLAVRRVLASCQQEAPEVQSEARATDHWIADPAGRAAVGRFARARAALPPPATVPGMADGNGEDESVFVRGSHRQRGEPAPRRFLEALCGTEPMVVGPGSGRLQLVRTMFAPDDPLPARVLVNRVWHHLFGRGIVRTVDNFGHLGEPPSHPLLLDRLALDLIRDGWSHKRLLRRVLLSATYAQSSTPVPAAAQRDPDNRLFHRQNLRRLQGEALRDALLVFAARLDPRLGGPPVPLPADAHPKARGKSKKSGPLDGRGRRSIYLALQRNFLPDFLVAFDLPQPFATVGARNVSNVPAQALALLNDPFVHAMCARAAERLCAEGPGDPAARLEHWFLAAFARPPAPGEAEACLQFLAAERRARAAAPEDPAPWAALAHVLVNRKEFQFLR